MTRHMRRGRRIVTSKDKEKMRRYAKERGLTVLWQYEGKWRAVSGWNNVPGWAKDTAEEVNKETTK